MLGPRLTDLDLSHNHIAVLPPPLFRCAALRFLRLDANQITELPPEFPPPPLPPPLLVLSGHAASLTPY